MHDTVDLEDRGRPTVFVSTVEFEDGARAQAKALGTTPTAVYVAHPIQDRSDDEMRALAEGAVDEIVARLVDDPSREPSSGQGEGGAGGS